MNFLEGLKLIKQKEFGKALNIFLELEHNTNNNDPRLFFYLGLIYFELNNYKNSILYYKKFLTEEPNSLGALHNLAIVKQTIGDLDAAKVIYLKLIKINNKNIRAYYGLYMLNQNYLTDDHFKTLSNINKTNNLNLYEKGIIDFLLSRKEQKVKNYKKELVYLKDSHINIFNSNKSYNLSSQFYYNKIICNYFDTIKIINNSRINQKNLDVPIFIIGLPRSGSTLVESILTSSDEKIQSFGESHVFNMSILDQIGIKIYKKNFNYKEFKFEINFEKLHETVINRYYKFNNNKSNFRFIDKSLENFFNISIINSIFPNAKFLHTFRNPIDSVISIYQSMLPDLSWTHNIEDILIYVDNYLKAINYFKAQHPKLIMDINLENFTKNSEIISKKIFKFCKLTWNKEILKFYERENLYSKTLSFTQIRSKITKYNEKKYEPYFHLLYDYQAKYKWLNF